MLRILTALALIITSVAPASAEETAREHVVRVGDKAMAAFQRGFATGKWDEFFGMLDDNIVFWFPGRSEERRHFVGKDKMAAFFRPFNDGKQHAQAGIRFSEFVRTTTGENHIVWEIRDQTENAKGEVVYRNRVLLSWDVCGEKICAYREYFGSDRKSN